MAAAQSRAAFITLEGGEGSGKTTLAAAIADSLRDQGQTVCATWEPGRTELGRLIQGILEMKAHASALSALAELLLFEADRVQHVSEVVRRALTAGRLVICRPLTDSARRY